MGNTALKWLKTINLENHVSQKQAALIWATYDVNEDGVLSKSEVESCLKNWCELHELQDVENKIAHFWQLFDQNHDGVISKAEIVGEISEEEQKEVVTLALANALRKADAGLLHLPSALGSVPTADETKENNTKDTRTECGTSETKMEGDDKRHEVEHDHPRFALLKAHLPNCKQFEELNFDSVPLAECMENMQTGDLILFSGMYSSSNIFKRLQGSPLTHVALVLMIDGVPHLWESTMCWTHDTWSGVIRNGPGAFNFLERFRQYYGWVIYRRLVWERPADLQERIAKIRQDTAHCFYDSNLSEGVKATFNLNGKPNNDAFFCSEFVSHVYQELGILPKARTPNTFFPADYSSVGGGLLIRRGTRKSNMVCLTGGAYFEPEKIIMPSWTDYHPKEVLLEEFLIHRQVSMPLQELQSRTNCTVTCVLDRLEGFHLNCFGKPSHGEPTVELSVGMIPEEFRFTKFFHIRLHPHQPVEVPFIEDHPYLSIWLFVKDSSLGHRIRVLKLAKEEPSTSQEFRARTGSVWAKLWVSKAISIGSLESTL